MTIPFERTRAVILTREFLKRLQDPQASPGVPSWARDHAKILLEHYPTYAEVELAHQALPGTYGPVPPYSRLSGSADARGVIDAVGKGRASAG